MTRLIRFALLFHLISLSVADLVCATTLDPGEILETFDPYGDTNAPIRSESEAIDRLRSVWMFSLGYTYVRRSGFDADYTAGDSTPLVEQLQMWTLGMQYTPWTFLFFGAALPMAASKRDGGTIQSEGRNVDTGARTLVPFPDQPDWQGGMADLSTYIGSELPWIPLTLTGLLMWPTGDMKKGMGTGEFSAGLMADLHFTFGKVRTRLGGFYFFLQDPVVGVENEFGNVISKVEMELADTYGASFLASVPVGPTILGAGLKWSHRTLVTFETVHIVEPILRVVWPARNWFATVLNINVEVIPVVAFAPTLALVFSI